MPLPEDAIGRIYMKIIKFSISRDIFTLFPGYCRGIVFALGVQNSPTPQKLVQVIRKIEQDIRTRIKPEEVSSHARLKSWREAYRTFGAKPSEYRSSIESLTRRALKETIPSINTLVDIGNLVSLKYLVPVGGHAIDVIKHDIDLRRARGDEDFVAFGTDIHEHPLPGEIIFVEENTVLTRRWTWRQANHTLVVPQTKAIEINVDGLPPVTEAEVESICKEVISLVESYCGGKTSYAILNTKNSETIIDIEGG
jgi:DNA/RNA-binding domain of Phe-tRNA-synthetase-like protein